MDQTEDSAGRRAFSTMTRVMVLVLLLALAAEALSPAVTLAERAHHGGAAGAEVVGGKPVPRGRFSFMTFVRFSTDSGTFQCGGSLIAPNFVLTAAHCTQDPFTFADLPASAFTLFIGRADVGQPVPATNVRQVTQVFRHPGWTPATFQNDVAVLELDAAVPPSIAQPLSVVSPGQTGFDRAGREAVVAGWGATSSGGSTSDRLLEADLTMVSDGACAAAYGEEFAASVMVCAARLGRDSCQGDSGGPLMAREVIGHKVKKKRKRKHRKRRKKRIAIVREVQTGIVSFGNGCADPDFPGVYTRLSAPAINDFVVGVIDP